MTVVNTTPPVITGTAQQGRTLATTNGEWTFDLDYLTYTYSWLRCDAAGANCVAIPNATGTAYLLAAADVGSTLRSEVTATENTFPAGQPALPPNGWTTPLTISAGGTYDAVAGVGVAVGVGWESNSTTPAITITTAQPVTIRGWVRNLAGGRLIQYTTSGSQVTIDHVFAYGAANLRSPSNRFIAAANIASLTVTNCTIENTHGIEIQTPQTTAAITVQRNIHNNICGGLYGIDPGPGNFVQVQDAYASQVIDISWNQIINEYNESMPTDIISLFRTSNAKVHDNYIRGQYPPNNSFSPDWAQNTITMDAYNHPLDEHGNEIYSNQLVRCLGIGMFVGGSNNYVHDNRTISDGKLDDGVTDYGGFSQPFQFYTGGSGNRCHSNTVAYVNRGSYMYGSFGGTDHGDPGERSFNTYQGPPVTQAMIDAEWTSWQAKLASSGITIGA